MGVTAEEGVADPIGGSQAEIKVAHSCARFLVPPSDASESTSGLIPRYGWWEITLHGDPQFGWDDQGRIQGHFPALRPSTILAVILDRMSVLGIG